MRKTADNLTDEGVQAPNRPRAWFRWWQACVYLLLTTLLCYAHAIGPGRTFLPADLTLLIPPWSHHAAEIAPNWHGVARPVWDPLFQFYPARKFMVQAIQNGFVPWHDPYIYSGSPFIADGQSAFFYPINWLYAILPLASAFGIVAMLHTFATGLFFTLFMRRRGMGWEASLVGATTWMLCGTLVAWQMWQVVDSTLCWVPLCLYFADCVSRPKPLDRFWLNFAGLAVSIGLMLVAGHIQFALYGVIVVIAYILTISQAKLATRIAILIGVIGVAGLIASAQILPTIGLLRDSLRGQNSLSDLLSTAMPASHLALLFMPEILGGYRDWQAHSYIGSVNYYELTSYLGVAAIVFAAFASYRPNNERKRELFLWAGIAIFGLLVGIGTPVYNFLFYAIPIVKSFHGVARTLVLTELSIAVLASYGLQTAIDSADNKLAKAYFGKCAGSVALVAVALYGIVASRTPQPVAFQLTHDWLVYGLEQLSRAIVTVALVWICAVVVSSKLRWLSVIVVAADMLTFASGLNPGADSAALYPKVAATDAMIQASGAGRVVCLGGNRPLDRMIPNSAESVGMRDVSGSDPLTLANYASFINALNTQQTGTSARDGVGIVSEGGSPALNYLNVTAIVSPQPLAIPGYVMAYSGADVYVYTNSLAKGEVWLTDTSPKSDFTDFFNGAVPINLSDFDHVVSITQSPEQITAQITASKNEIAVISEIADSSWKLNIDGKPTVWKPAYGLLVSAPVTSGQHTLELRYLPSAGQVGLYLSAVGWLIISWLLSYQIAEIRLKKSPVN